MRVETPLQQILLKLKSVFPEAVTETAHQDENGELYYRYALKGEFVEMLEGAELDIVSDQNRYELQFPGKQLAKATAFTPCYKTLIADKEQSVNFDDTANLFIEGDNLDALRMMQIAYRGKVKMIYIDPPYNTGSDDFTYNDDFSMHQKDYLKAAGVLDEDGERQISEVQTGLKGRFHAGWLASMYPRLKLARELLREDGVIFISIDDNEVHNLRLIMDEIFGEENFINLITVVDNLKGNNSDKFFSGINDYGLIYAKNIDQNIVINKLANEDDWENWETDVHGLWKRGGILSATQGKTSENTNNNFSVYVSINDEVFLSRKNKTDIELIPMSRGKKTRWYWSKDTFKKQKYNILVVRTSDTISLYKKQRMELLSIPQKIPKTVMYHPSYGQGGSHVEQVTGEMNLFSNPKSVNLIKDIVHILAEKNAVVLDFFAGSATTAHAVMKLNAEDGGNRKFIMVQLPELCDEKSEAHKAGYRTIADIAKERIRRAGKQMVEQKSGEFADKVDIGFKSFVIQDSLLNDGKDQPFSGIKEDARQTELAAYKTDLKAENFTPLLYEAMLKTGVMLDNFLTIHTVGEYQFAITDHRCYCVTENLSQAIVQAIVKDHVDEFDCLYYLSDALDAKTSYTEIEAPIHAANKKIKALSFY